MARGRAEKRRLENTIQGTLAPQNSARNLSLLKQLKMCLLRSTPDLADKLAVRVRIIQGAWLPSEHVGRTHHLNGARPGQNFELSISPKNAANLV